MSHVVSRPWRIRPWQPGRISRGKPSCSPTCSMSTSSSSTGCAVMGTPSSWSLSTWGTETWTSSSGTPGRLPPPVTLSEPLGSSLEPEVPLLLRTRQSGDWKWEAAFHSSMLPAEQLDVGLCPWFLGREVEDAMKSNLHSSSRFSRLWGLEWLQGGSPEGLQVCNFQL